MSQHHTQRLEKRETMKTLDRPTQNTRISRLLRLLASVTLLAASALACTLPFVPGGNPPAANTPAAIATSQPGGQAEIPASILTEVAATLFAPHQATWTAQALNPPASTASAQQPAPSPTSQAQPTQVKPSPTSLPPTQPAPTAAPPTAAQPTAALPTVALTLFPTAVTAPLPTAYQPVAPPSDFIAQSGSAFTIFSLNLQACGGEFAANFLVENTGSQALESLSLHFIDLSSDQELYDPVVSNAPFSWTDRTCTSDGISRLAPGEWLFAGALLGPGSLSGHSILANFLFCTQEDLNGQCYPRSVEFVVP